MSVEPLPEVTQFIAAHEGWKQQNLQQFRDLVHATLPNATETFKWSVPVFLVNGKLLCAMSTFKGHTKYNFFIGASLNDKHGLFNNGLTSKTHRSIDLQDGASVNQSHLRDLLEQAAALVA